MYSPIVSNTAAVPNLGNMAAPRSDILTDNLGLAFTCCIRLSLSGPQSRFRNDLVYFAVQEVY